MYERDAILHEDGEFRLIRLDNPEFVGLVSVLAHKCRMYPPPSRKKWWFLAAPHKCTVCGTVPSDEIQGLYRLHNWDRLQAVK